MEPLFSKDDLSQDVRIKTIADITCDVEGSIPITWKATTIEDPIIGWDLKTQKPGKPFENNTIDIMSVTNLPSELPKSASEDFSKKMRTLIIPELLNNGKIIKEATLVSNGNICSKYAYLDNWLKG
jgi:alanine dehydrogenase